MRWRWAVLALVLLTGSLLFRADRAPAFQEKVAADSFAKDIEPFLKKHCIACHGPVKKKAELEFHKFTDEKSVLKNRSLFQSMVHMVQLSEMPPSERKKPSDEEVETFVRGVKDIFAKADKNAKPDPGRVTMRRLNRAEYNNTIRDLVGADFDATEFLPQDDVGYGFDNIGDVLTISPFLMERYLSAADNIMQRAIVIDLPKPTVRHMNAKYLEPSVNPGTVKGGRTLTAAKSRLHTPYKTAIDGDFTLRVKGAGQPLGDEPVRFVLDINGKELKTFEVKDGKSQVHEVNVRLEPGNHRAGVTFLNEFADKDKKRGLNVEWIELVGPMDMRSPAHRRLLASKAATGSKEAEVEILTRFASGAYRRTATDDEVQRLVKLAQAAQARGEKWEASLQLAMQAVLCSPKFLFRVELDHRPDSADAHPIEDFQLASRLSYFLWSSMPDEELFRLAAKKELHQNLEAQVKRMLQDPKSSALVENFGMQWLQLRVLANANPDRKLFPEWDESLRKAMVKETELFLNAVVREDRSILDLIDADFTYMNERLGRHYGIVDTVGNKAGDAKKVPGGVPLKGGEFRRVQLQGGERGGILTQASVLTLNSNPTRTSPVKRGKWVLEQILGTPPPPPPANVPELAEGDKAELKGSLRQRMEQHRKDPNCTTCHARMDPLGFAFENFNAIGRFRSKDGDFPIDPSGTLPGGQVFQGAGDLKRILKGKKDLFGRCLTEKMLTYASGRGLEYYDKAAIDGILSTLAKNDYRFSTLVVEVAKSDPFRLRRGKDQK